MRDGRGPFLFYLNFAAESMPIRDFTDAGGVHWQVWATTPMRGDVRPQFAAGWLAFESGAERRRLAPIPSTWEEAPDAALCELLAKATAVARGAALRPVASPAADAASAPAASAAPVETPAVTAAAVPGEARTVVPAIPPPPPLMTTVAKVRAVMREVDEVLRRKPAG